VGVTTLGLVGETTQGPAFQPIFVSNYDEFRSFFGGLDATRVKDTGAPKYELPYIAKSYLSQSNQLFVTRVLGFSGYDAGLAWGITLSAALDPDTIEVVSATSYSPLISFTGDSTGAITNLVSTDSVIQSLWDDGVIGLDYLTSAAVGPVASVPLTFQKVGLAFQGAEIDNFYLTSVTSNSNGVTGVTSGNTIVYSGAGYSNVENKIVALLRSRGRYNGSEQLVFEVSANTQVDFATTPLDAETNPYGDFAIEGTSNISGAFRYDLSFDRTKKNYITRVLGKIRFLQFAQVGCLHILHGHLPLARGSSLQPTQSALHLIEPVLQRFGQALIFQCRTDQSSQSLFEISCAFQRVG
jgi:hypothetical protein